LSTDLEWERWGARDPYYGVLTDPKYRNAALTPEAKAEFFASGDWHASFVLSQVRRHIDPAFKPQRILEFGCGVGRVAIPFAREADEVVGMDVSPAMLAEAQRNCDERGIANIKLVLSDDVLSQAHGGFDLVHSCIVLQHIEVPRGMALMAQLVNRIRPGGVGVIQLTFASTLYRDSDGRPPPPEPPPPLGPWTQLKALIKQVIGWQPRPPPQQPPPDPGCDPETCSSSSPTTVDPSAPSFSSAGKQGAAAAGRSRLAVLDVEHVGLIGILVDRPVRAVLLRLKNSGRHGLWHVDNAQRLLNMQSVNAKPLDEVAEFVFDLVLWVDHVVWSNLQLSQLAVRGVQTEGATTLKNAPDPFENFVRFGDMHMLD
jgi:SAM-dependent methyltransferase